MKKYDKNKNLVFDSDYGTKHYAYNNKNQLTLYFQVIEGRFTRELFTEFKYKNNYCIEESKYVRDDKNNKKIIATTLFEYSEEGLLLLSDDGKFVKKYEYDINGKNTLYQKINKAMNILLKSEKREYNNLGKETYFEDLNGFWEKKEYNELGKEIFFTDVSGRWIKRTVDKNNNQNSYTDSSGYWEKSIFDNESRLLCFKDSNKNRSEYSYDDKGNRTVLYRTEKWIR